MDVSYVLQVRNVCETFGLDLRISIFLNKRQELAFEFFSIRTRLQFDVRKKLLPNPIFSSLRCYVRHHRFQGLDVVYLQMGMLRYLRKDTGHNTVFPSDLNGFSDRVLLTKMFARGIFRENNTVWFVKPTLAFGKNTFRSTREGALAYFVGGDKNDRPFSVYVRKNLAPDKG